MNAVPPLKRTRDGLVSAGLLAALLGVAAFCLALRLHPRFHEFHSRRPDSDNVLARFLGDGRRLFANHVYIKADEYFHSGFYPSIFDNRESHQTPHMAEDAGVSEGRNTGDEGGFLGVPRDWFDRHGRRHFPSVHSHLDQEPCAHCQSHSHSKPKPAPHAHADSGSTSHSHPQGHTHGKPDAHDHGDPGHAEPDVQREILPWLVISSQLDPNLVESYTVGAYWLRRIGKPREAEGFLREGLRSNPMNPELLFELGRCRLDAADPERARNIWEVAWRRWSDREAGKPVEEQNRFMANQILLNLAAVESRLKNQDQCIHWLQTLVPLAISPDEIQKRIVEVRQGLPLEATGP